MKRVRLLLTVVACVSIVLIAIGQAPGQARAQLKQAQLELEGYYLKRFVEVKMELPYVKRAVVIDKTNQLQIQPIDPKDRAEERYAKVGKRHRVLSVKIERGQVVLEIRPSYELSRGAPLPPPAPPPINPDSPPWKPPEGPRPKPSKIPFKRAEPVNFTLVLEYSSVDELTPDRINARLEPVLRMMTNK